MNMRHFAVLWPIKDKIEQCALFLRGRRLSEFVTLDHPWVFNTENSQLIWYDFSPAVMRGRSPAETAKAGIIFANDYILSNPDS